MRILLIVLFLASNTLVAADVSWLTGILPRLQANNGTLDLVMPADQVERSTGDALVVDRLWSLLPEAERRAHQPRQWRVTIFRVGERKLPFIRHRLPADTTLRADQILTVRFHLSPELACPEAHGLVSLVDGTLLHFCWEGG